MRIALNHRTHDSVLAPWHQSGGGVKTCAARSATVHGASHSVHVAPTSAATTTWVTRKPEVVVGVVMDSIVLVVVIIAVDVIDVIISVDFIVVVLVIVVAIVVVSAAAVAVVQSSGRYYT